VKLATLANGSRDGRLVVVSRDLAHATDARGVAQTLQNALDDWARLSPKLEALAAALETGSVPRERFREHDALSPLPRAFPWIDAFLAPREPIRMADEGFGIDFEGEVAVVVDDVAMGADRAEAAAAIALVLLANDISLRNLIPAELAKGFGFFQAKPSSAFSPVAVTPSELGASWDGGRLHLPLLVSLNGKPFGRADAGTGMIFDFPALIAHAARTRPLGAGTIVGSGTVSNKGADGGPGRPVAEGGVGYSCLAEARMVETIRDGATKTPFMRFGDTVRIEMKNRGGQSIFGAIEQTVEPYARPPA
jgi:fumarylacetoacetate (FAA) hydrolase